MIWRRRYLALVVFLLPWQAGFFWPRLVNGGVSQYLTMGVYVTDVFMLGAVLLYRPSFVWLRARWREVFVVATLLVANAAVAIDPLAAIWKMVTVGLIVAFVACLRKNGNRELTVRAAIASGAVAAVVGLQQFLTQTISASSWVGVSQQLTSVLGTAMVESASGRWLRAYGLFPHPNIAGGFLAFMLLLTLDQYFKAYEKFQTWWNSEGVVAKQVWRKPIVQRTAGALTLILAAYIIMLSGLLVTFSRSAALAMVLASATYLFMKLRQNRIRALVLGTKIFLVSAAVMGMWFALLPDLLATRTIHTLQVKGDNVEQQSFAERRLQYQQASGLLQQYPALGTGLQNYTVRLAEQYPRFSPGVLQPVHNTWLLFIIEVGVVGLLVAVWMGHKKNLRSFITPLFSNPLAVALMVAVLVLASLDHYLWSLHAGLVLWPLLLAVL